MLTMIILGLCAVGMPLLALVVCLVIFFAFRKPSKPSLPGASAFDKQVAIEMLDGVVLAKARANVVQMLRESVAAPQENPVQSSSSPAVKQPIA